MGRNMENENGQTLLERVGGISFITILLNSLYDELLESPELEHFFRRAPIETIKTHQSVLFRLILGSEDCLPSQEKLINYILASHSRLFRDAGLNETHFDLVAGCLVNTLQAFQVGQILIEEIVSILLPFRAVFEYGAKIAVKEKEMGVDEKRSLPLCSALTLGTDIPSILPNPPLTEVPSWLLEEMGKVARKKSLRDWTSVLSDRCSATGDILLADVMMDIPMFQLESYLASVFQLAFLPDNIDDNISASIALTVRHPRGLSKDPLSRHLFDRLVVEFGKTCDDMEVKRENKKDLVEKLRSFRKSFPKLDASKVNGVSNPSSILIDKTPEKVVNTLASVMTSTKENEKIDKTKRFSLSTKSSSAMDDIYLIESINSPQQKKGISKWFGVRKALTDTKLTI